MLMIIDEHLMLMIIKRPSNTDDNRTNRPMLIMIDEPFNADDNRRASNADDNKKAV